MPFFGPEMGWGARKTNWNPWADLADLFYPRICACGQAVLQLPGAYVCTDCLKQFVPTGFGSQLASNALALRFPADLPLVGAYAPWWFRKEGRLQQHIFQLKYGQQARIGQQLGRQLAAGLAGYPFLQQATLVPVPLHPLRYRRRGYNQSLHIARGIWQQLQLPIADRLVARSRNTVSQTGLNRAQRQENVRDLFVVRGPAPRLVWIVDDVITTGATTTSLARALVAAGTQALFISGLALAEEDGFQGV